MYETNLAAAQAAHPTWTITLAQQGDTYTTHIIDGTKMVRLSRNGTEKVEFTTSWDSTEQMHTVAHEILELS